MYVFLTDLGITNDYEEFYLAGFYTVYTERSLSTFRRQYVPPKRP
jgi:hypothetical protein